MADRTAGDPAEHLLRVALTHPQCREGVLLDPEGGQLRIRVDMNVEMPLHMKADGISESGVRTCEPVVIELPDYYPWRSPRVYLRDDFPRDFPHLQPTAGRPEPCLVEGDLNEFFLQFGLLESGIFHLVEQLAIWLRKAAAGTLIAPDQGWEPALRRNMNGVIECDAEQVRSEVDRQGGFAMWRARFMRRGAIEATLGTGVDAWISSKGDHVPLTRRADDQTISARGNNEQAVGGTVVAIIWPDKKPDGSPAISAHYLPETVTTLGDLRSRAEELGCGRGLRTFLNNLERSFAGFNLAAPIPIGIILCARRPVHLIGATSDIELLPYVVEIRADEPRSTLFADGDTEPVTPAMHYQAVTSVLMRTLAGTPERPALAIMGCGSVGSKLALHAARSGQMISSVCDNADLRPHNMARHGLGPEHVAQNKAEALAHELSGFGLAALPYRGDLVGALRDTPDLVLPKGTGAVVNSTASLAVREALAAAVAANPRLKPRLAEAALFGRGHGAYLLIDGKTHNPTHCDLIAELYATLEDEDVARLLLDPSEGLSAIQIGQGCSSLTMPIEDARLSAMTAAIALELGAALDAPAKDGLIVVGSGSGGASTHWTHQAVPPFEVVDIAGSPGWQLRLSKRVADRIRQEALSHPGVETGGLLIGLTSARLGVVTVVDLLEAPADSQRTATHFVLGTEGLQAMIEARHLASGQTLFDVGTWHCHLSDEGPSRTDWKTAADLAAGRAPPSILLISTPERFFALSANESPTDGRR